jgi:hypothetical protein
MEAYVHDAVLDMRHARDELLAALDEVGPDEWDRQIPYGTRTLHELLAHLASADQAWALAAQGLLKGEAEPITPLTPEQAKEARRRAIERGRTRSVAFLRAEMDRRRQLLLGLYDLLEPRHLALALRSYGDEHNSVRERIWLGYHDRLHAADVRGALRMHWKPPKLEFLPPILPAVEALSPDAALYVIYSVDPTRWEMPSVVPGWSNRNLLAHIATGDWVFQSNLRSIMETGAAPVLDIDAGNAQRVEDRRFTTVNTLIDEYRSTRHATMLLLAQLTPRHLAIQMPRWWVPDPGGERTVAACVLAFPRRHERHHIDHLRPAMKWATSVR